MTQQQQKNFISSLSMSLESAQPPAATQNTAPAANAPASQLMQQLQQPLDVKPPVNNTPSSANKSIIPNTPTQSALPPSTTKAEPPHPSPTGNNNKSNINNLNHLTQNQNQQNLNTVGPPQPQQQQPQQPPQSLLMNHMPSNGNMQPTTTPQQPPPAPSIIQQQMVNNPGNGNLLQGGKHQTSFPPMNFVDPLEHTLASLEQPQMNNNNKNSQELAMLMDLQKQQQLLNHLTVPNGFNSDFNGSNGVNNIMNMFMPPIDPQSLAFFNQQMKPGRSGFNENWPGNNPMMLAAQHQQQQQIPNQQPQTQIPHQHQNKSDQKIMLTPKPIEELLMNPNDKSKGLGAPPAFSQAFNKTYEQNLKNASSWSQLAAAGSPQNPPSATVAASKTKNLPSDTFQEYRTKAKEQAQRQKQEQEKIKKQKEQELKRQQESLQKHKTPQPTEDLSNGHR